MAGVTKEEAPPKKKQYCCNESFTYKGVSYQEHQKFDGSDWHKDDLKAAIKTNLIKEISENE